MIKTNQIQIFTFKFVPKSESFLVEKCELMLNYLPSKLLDIAMVGSSLTAKINLENNGMFYFSPTCKGNVSFQTFKLTNLTRSKITYEWRVPYESKNLFTVDETKSELKPYEVKNTLWKFTPSKIDKYNNKAALITWIDDDKKNTSKTYFVRMLGTCTNGSLQSSEMYRDFGNVIVGSSISSEITILNNNDCYLDFELSVKQTVDESLANNAANDICILELEKTSGHIDARSSLIIRCRLRPTRLINYQFTVEYRIIYPNENKLSQDLDSKETSNEQKEILCYLSANGVYPKLRINDIKTLGSASSLSKDFFWKLLSINQ
jgi:hypothetical protein